MENCDLAFEYSEVDAEVQGEILSVKNPRSGVIRADRVGEIILTSDSVWPPEAEILTRDPAGKAPSLRKEGCGRTEARTDRPA